jgi:hypothetical protein
VLVAAEVGTLGGSGGGGGNVVVSGEGRRMEWGGGRTGSLEFEGTELLVDYLPNNLIGRHGVGIVNIRL